MLVEKEAAFLGAGNALGSLGDVLLKRGVEHRP